MTLTDAGVRRTTRRFDWSLVDEMLTRRMLIAAYTAAGQDDDAALVRRLPSDELPKQAEATLGRPPGIAHLGVIADVLRDHWLPRLSPDELDYLIWNLQLSLSGPARTATPSTKAKV